MLKVTPHEKGGLHRPNGTHISTRPMGEWVQEQTARKRCLDHGMWYVESPSDDLSGGACMWPDVDRRGEPRVEIAVPVQVGEREPIEGESRDLSVEGMRIELNRRLDLATEVRLTFELPGEPTAISTTAEVRWCKQVGPKSANQWVAGLNFDDLSERQHRDLARYLERADDER